MEGGLPVSELIHFEVLDLPAMAVVGKAIHPPESMQDNPIPAFWGQCFSEGVFAALEQLQDFVLDPSYVGFMCDWNAPDGTFTYICGMMMKPGCPVPDGYVSRPVPPSKVAIGWVRGPEQDNYAVAHELTLAALQKAGHRADEAAMWCAEVYNCPRFTTKQDNGDVILDYYIPCL
ncbi:MAG: GyrI-like domain-containing protein [Clostridiales bacterium]|nr:GyrI-like domain-containing protein [Clostridiales bacterium]